MQIADARRARIQNNPFRAAVRDRIQHEPKNSGASGPSRRRAVGLYLLDGYWLERSQVQDRRERALLWDLWRSEEHTSELQSLRHLVCRLLLEKKKNNN